LDANTKYLMRSWGLAVLFGGFALFGAIAAIQRGEFVIPAVMVAAVALVLLQRWHLKQKAMRFFRDNTPDSAITYYRSNMSRAQNGAPLAAYMCGLVFSLYGEYDNARDELANVSWANFPPMYDGFRTYVLSIIAILEKKDFSKALDLALEARDLCVVPAGFPGVTTSRQAFDAHVLACELLARHSDSTAVDLEAALKNLAETAPVIPLWSLAQHYIRNGKTHAANAHIAALRRLVPNCQPLSLTNILRNSS
jgi:hypothetical protein